MDRPMTLDGDYTALFASIWQRVPVFHGFDHARRRNVGSDFTRCGLLVSNYDSETHRLTEKMTWVPMRHALAFGRPCRRCYPKGDK